MNIFNLNELSELIKQIVLEQLRTVRPPKKWLNKKQACQYLGVSYNTLARWQKTGLLVPYRFDSFERYSTEQLDNFVMKGTKNER